MIPAIRLGDFNLNDGNTYKVTRFIHDGGTPYEHNMMEISRRDGQILISSTYAPKKITVEGAIYGTSQANLETNIDTFKRYTSVAQENLDIQYAGGDRRYGVVTTSIIISRDYYHLTFAPFVLEFIAYDPPFGKECDMGSGDIMTEMWSADALTNLSETFSADIQGTARPRPVYDFVFDTVGNLGGISVKTNNQELAVYTAFSDGDSLSIDSDNFTVTKNGNPVEFEGIFPEVNLGDESFELTVSPSGAINTEQTVNTGYTAFGSAPTYFAAGQGFKVSSTANYTGIAILIKRGGNYGCTLSIQTDTGGLPSGTTVSGSSVTLTSSSIGTDFSWVTFTFTSPLSLTSGTQYHIVVEGLGSAIYWADTDTNPYANGKQESRDNKGNWTQHVNDDYTFKVYKQITQNWYYSSKATYNKRYL